MTIWEFVAYLYRYPEPGSWLTTECHGDRASLMPVGCAIGT